MLYIDKACCPDLPGNAPEPERGGGWSGCAILYLGQTAGLLGVCSCSGQTRHKVPRQSCREDAGWQGAAGRAQLWQQAEKAVSVNMQEGGGKPLMA